MDGTGISEIEDRHGRRITMRLVALCLVLLSYVAAIAIATSPRSSSMTTMLPVLGDPIMHLWIMRWNKACLLEGHSTVIAPGVQAPVGLPLGLMPPLHLQSLEYIALSTFLTNDILTYNLIWYFGYLLTGMGGFALAWSVTRSGPGSWLAGLLLMISTPMMLHGAGHLELIQLGWSPLFLVVWLKFVESPTMRRMLASVLMYLMVVMSAPYYPLFMIFPAALFVIQQALKARSSPGVWAWTRGRLGWLAGFSGLVAPCLVLLFWNYIWAGQHGYAVTRSKADFEVGGTPIWSYLMPTNFQRLGQLLPFDAYAAIGLPCERGSYLGLSLIGLLCYAAFQKVSFANARFWWSAFALTIVLSLGAKWHFGKTELDLPSSWLLAWFPPFRLIRMTARFNLFVVMCGVVIASAGLMHLLARVPSRSLRVSICAGLAAFALVDLPLNPYFTCPMPAMPLCYERIAERDKNATVLEIPQLSSAIGMAWNPMLSYWQTIHGLKSTGGATSQINYPWDDLMAWNSPFTAWDLANPEFLAKPDSMSIGVVNGIGYRDYAWLYLKVHDLRFVVLHKWPSMYLDAPMALYLDPLKSILADLTIDDDATTTVYDRDLLGPPHKPVVMLTEGWRHRFLWKGRLTRLVPREAHLAVYNPTPNEPLRLTIDASSFNESREVFLHNGSKLLATWRIGPDAPQSFASPAFLLTEGLHDLTITTDGDTKPSKRYEAAPGEDMRPFSLRVNAVSIDRQAVPAVAQTPDRSGPH